MPMNAVSYHYLFALLINLRDGQSSRIYREEKETQKHRCGSDEENNEAKYSLSHECILLILANVSPSVGILMDPPLE